MPNRNLSLRPQRIQNAEALRLRKIFEIDSAEAGLDRQYGLDDLVGVFGVEHDGPGIYPAQIFVEQRLAFHHWQACFGSNVAESQHARAIGDDGDGVPLVRVFVNQFGIGGNGFARRRHAGRIPNSKVVKVAHAAAQRGFNLATIKRMQTHRIRRRLLGFRQQFFGC